jgi:hypothetical protein
MKITLRVFRYGCLEDFRNDMGYASYLLKNPVNTPGGVNEGKKKKRSSVPRTVAKRKNVEC